MKKFVFKLLTFLCCFFTTFICVFGFHYFVIGNQHLGNYQASLLDKVERLQSIEEPKIVLIGNSNVSFGMDSKQIEEAIGMPVVNMGLHAGMGNAFHENMVKYGVSKGDIVILCHTAFDDDGPIPDTSLAWGTIEMHKELWTMIKLIDIPSMARAYPDYFKDSLIYWMEGSLDNTAVDTTSYSRSSFNEYGDIVNRFENTYKFKSDSVRVPSISKKCVRRINKLNAYINKQGATLLIAGYPIGYGEYTPAAELYDEFENELRDAMDCDVISHYTDYFIPYDKFYDTKFHLTDEGVDIRTKQLISDIKSWMNENKK